MSELTKAILEISNQERNDNVFISLEDLLSCKIKCRQVFGPQCRTITTPNGLMVFTKFEKGTIIPRHYHDFTENILITAGELEELVTGKKIKRFTTIEPYRYHAFKVIKDTSAVINCASTSVSTDEVMQLSAMFNYLQH